MTMDISIIDRFITMWEKYFPGAELPVALELKENSGSENIIPPPEGWRCILCQMNKVRTGEPVIFDTNSITCAGGRKYSGFSHDPPPNFRYFISEGTPGIIEGERYKQTPELVDDWARNIPEFSSQGKTLQFTRWDKLTEKNTPDIVIFFARPEVLSGLFTLANFDQSDPNGVICPMGAGCSSILLYPLLEQKKENPKAVLGMFDPSARKCVPLDVLTMSFPMKKFEKIIGYMEKSFLITKDWESVQKKIGLSVAKYKKD